VYRFEGDQLQDLLREIESREVPVLAASTGRRTNQQQS
jgi:hypothetical protein